MSDNISQEVLAAGKDENLRNSFIGRNRHFILTAAYKAVGYFVTESDDEYSIALIAFNEAIDSWDMNKGGFYPFAALVIKRRLYDYVRSQSRFTQEISVEPDAMTADAEEDSPYAAIHSEIRRKQVQLSEENTDSRPGSTPIKDEIDAVQEILSGYGFSFFDLTECSPKAVKTKKACADAVNYMLAHKELIGKMRSSKNLPVSEIKENAGVSRKILERHRKYIIAAVEILNGEYPLLAEYMSYIKKALET